ncbi:type III secretion protein HrpB4 [Burkholderia sp. BCC1998]|uniref:type III secretion protein HrpB4 n=1 Tax=Burkholderia sp. BCC1998 TaxID=2817447 RepID=UPI002AB6ABE0|nr:type III secretion protein HrpB4 [Burkholderia sp. BCC1998]
MHGVTDSPFRRAAAVLAAWQRNATSVLQWAHPSWLASALAIGEADALALTRATVERSGAGAPADTMPATGEGAVDSARGSRAHLDVCSLALLRSVGLAWPELDALARPGAMRLDVLPPELGLCVLRIRALRFRRGEIRRIVDKRTRTNVVQWAGVPVDVLTREMPNERAAVPDIGQMSARVPIPPIAALDGDTLALEGLALLQRDLRSAVSPCPLLRLALPRAAAGGRDGTSMAARGAGESRMNGHWVEQVPAEVDQHGTDAVFAQLPNLFPEWAWLFG